MTVNERLQQKFAALRACETELENAWKSRWSMAWHFLMSARGRLLRKLQRYQLQTFDRA